MSTAAAADTTTVVSTDDEFDKAMDEISKAAATAPVEGEPAAVVVAKEEPKVEPAKEEPKVEEPKKEEPKGEPAKEEPAKEEPKGEPAKEEPKVEEPKKEDPPAPKPVPKAAPVVVEPTQAEKDAAAAREKEWKDLMAPHAYTADQQATIDKFKTEFPDSHAAVELQLARQEKQFQQRLALAVQNVLTYTNTQLASVGPTVQNLAHQQHFSALRQAHPDHEALLPQVEAWVATLPKALKESSQATLDAGTTEDVIGLFSYYKTATGKTSAAAATPTPAATPTGKQPTAEEIAALKTPKPGQRTTPSAKGAPDPNDYDGAMAELEARHLATAK